MLTKDGIERKFKEQLALELNCAPEDFSGEENVITGPVLHENRRKFSDQPFFLQMATFGAGTVISADERLHPRLREWAKGKRGFWLFEQHNYLELDRLLRGYGYKMALTHHMFTPTTEIAAVETVFPVRRQFNEPPVICDFITHCRTPPFPIINSPISRLPTRLSLHRQ